MHDPYLQTIYINIALPFWLREKMVTLPFWLKKKFSDLPLDSLCPPAVNECSLNFILLVLLKTFPISVYSHLKLVKQYQIRHFEEPNDAFLINQIT